MGKPGYERGSVLWHASDEDSGPDVGIQLGLGDGFAIYFGEMPTVTLEEHEVPQSYPDGWWAVLYGPGDTWIIGAIPDRYRAQEAIERIAALIVSPSPSDGGR